jgi:leucyl aminopeptidase
MHFAVKSVSPVAHPSACIVLGVFESRRLSEAARLVDEASGDYLTSVLRAGDMDGKLEQTLLLHKIAGVHADRVLLVGCGKQSEFDSIKLRKVSAAAAKTLNEGGTTEAVSFLPDLPVKGQDSYRKTRHIVEATEDAVYQFTQLKTDPSVARRPLKQFTLALTQSDELPQAKRAVSEAIAIAGGIRIAKDLGNLPGNVCTPTYLAQQARGLGRISKKVKVTVLGASQMEKLGMGALLSVARGSRQPPKLITIEYQGGAKNDPSVVLVGKGVTFDSGGISIKPGAAMDEMKFDMCGAASVVGTLDACVRLKLPLNVVGIIPATENLPDGQASKPGDIVTSMSGQTIEILNTDAEGRLILCDALTYSEKFRPDVVIDIATLTGACVIALGNHAAGLLGNDEVLLQELLAAGQAANDRAWQLPLWDDYQPQLDSNFADIANIGGREGGTITAACFLSRFTEDYRWAHLDIAGVAWKTGKEKGATGRPVALLTQYLLNRCEAK